MGKERLITAIWLYFNSVASNKRWFKIQFLYNFQDLLYWSSYLLVITNNGGKSNFMTPSKLWWNWKDCGSWVTKKNTSFNAWKFYSAATRNWFWLLFVFCCLNDRFKDLLISSLTVVCWYACDDLIARYNNPIVHEIWYLILQQNSMSRRSILTIVGLESLSCFTLKKLFLNPDLRKHNPLSSSTTYNCSLLRRASFISFIYILVCIYFFASESKQLPWI